MSEYAGLLHRAWCGRVADPKKDSGWELLSNHGKVLVCLARDPDVRVSEIAEMVVAAVGYTGETDWDPTKPDGTPRKLLDISVLRNVGWQPEISLRDGIEATVQWYRANAAAARQ